MVEIGQKVKCRNCGHVDNAVFPPPAGTAFGEKRQEIPACASCRSGDIVATA